jgi:hypothetical protein
MVPIARFTTVAVLLAVIPLSAAQQKPTPPGAKPAVNSNAATLKEFTKRVDDYVALHKKLESQLPDLAKQTTPEAIDKHQRALAVLIQAQRKTARPGDIFTPAMQRLVRNLLRPVFSGKDGQQIKNEILDNEYKGAVKLSVNGRYPDDVPISTVPPQVLAQLPKLPEELEYRFIRNNLILFDPHAHIIVDFVERAFQ